MIRAWWAHRQGLDGTWDGASPAQVLERSGWARSVAGAGPYLTLFARAGLRRADVDTAVARVDIHELPSARGCTYVIPASDFALALKVGESFGGREMRVAEKLGVTEEEVEKLCDAILGALQRHALAPEELREAVGRAGRSLGAEGVNKGLAHTLTLGLGRLQVRGLIRRVPLNGRLDQQRYRYARWDPSPLSGFTLSSEEAFTELARRYFRWIGPACLTQFQWFSGLGAKAARAAVDPLELVSLGDEGGRLMYREDLEALRTFTPPKDAHFKLVSSLDAISVLKRNVRDLLDANDGDREVFGGKGCGGLTDLPSHAILDRGRLVGFWEFDPAADDIVWATFGVRSKALAAEVRRTEAYVRDDLGDARAFSLDTPKSRAPRIEALRKGF